MKKEKKALGFWQIWNLSFGFLGIQFGFALQNANASRILQTFGADVEHLNWFWLVAPLTGMIVQPIIGYYSDRTWTRLGRRRPFFLAGAILTSIALIAMPNAPHLASFIAPMFIGGGLLMIMDASINISMEPFRALVADKLPERAAYTRLFGSNIAYWCWCCSWFMVALYTWKLFWYFKRSQQWTCCTECYLVVLYRGFCSNLFYCMDCCYYQRIPSAVLRRGKCQSGRGKKEVQSAKNHDSVAGCTVFFVVCPIFYVGLHGSGSCFQILWYNRP